MAHRKLHVRVTVEARMLENSTDLPTQLRATTAVVGLSCNGLDKAANTVEELEATVGDLLEALDTISPSLADDLTSGLEPHFRDGGAEAYDRGQAVLAELGMWRDPDPKHLHTLDSQDRARTAQKAKPEPAIHPPTTFRCMVEKLVAALERNYPEVAGTGPLLSPANQRMRAIHREAQAMLAERPLAVEPLSVSAATFGLVEALVEAVGRLPHLHANQEAWDAYLNGRAQLEEWRSWE